MTIEEKIEVTEQSPSTPPAASEAPRGNVMQTLAEHIEPVTRFDITDLTEVEPEVQHLAHVTVRLAQTPHLRIAYREGKGPLPSGMQRVIDQAAMQAELAARLERAEAEVPQALQRWADENAGTYRRLMPASAAFLSAPQTIGYQYQCPGCDGDRVVGCSRCRVTGKVVCQGCNGHCTLTCPRCRGWWTNVSCMACQGRGTWYEQEYTGGAWRSVQRSCSVCGTKGTVFCTYCARGVVDCQTCGAQGDVTCGACGGRKTLDCGTCDASGLRNVKGEVNSSIEFDEGTPQTMLEDARAKALLAGMDPDRLRTLGELLDVLHSVSEHTLQTLHLLQIPVHRVTLQASGEVMELHGFGPRAEVFDFRNIAGRMLQGDLETLQAANAASTKGLRRIHAKAVLPALSTFLSSELNMTIAEAVANNEAAEGAERAVEQKFRGLVSRSYVQAATESLRNALGRAYGAEVAEPALYLAATATLASATMSWMHWPPAGWLVSAAVAVFACAIGWIITEIITERRIAKHFGKEMAGRVITQVHTTGNFDTWRFRALIGVFAGAIAGAWAPWQLGQHPSLGTRAIADSAVLLQQWQAQGPDIALRRFPDKVRLEKLALEGNNDARLMLAWGLALGTGGNNKNVARAQQQLDGSLRTTRDGKVIQAVITLNQAARPAEITNAAAALHEAAQAGVVEARYWHARALLAQQGPVYNAARGMDELREAASKGHGHAAFLLGRMYAAGRDNPRDSQKARRYLQQAQAAGILEAAGLLAKL